METILKKFHKFIFRLSVSCNWDFPLMNNVEDDQLLPIKVSQHESILRSVITHLFPRPRSKYRNQLCITRHLRQLFCTYYTDISMEKESFINVKMLQYLLNT